jgi:hypothetical protein
VGISDFEISDFKDEIADLSRKLYVNLNLHIGLYDGEIFVTGVTSTELETVVSFYFHSYYQDSIDLQEELIRNLDLGRASPAVSDYYLTKTGKKSSIYFF